MFKCIITCLIFFSSLFAQAGSPGYEAHFCTSASGKTKVTVVDRYQDGKGITIVLAIRGFVKLYDLKSLYCTSDDKCQIMELAYGANTTQYAVSLNQKNHFLIEIGENGKGKIFKGFIHPETLLPFKHDIHLTCRTTYQQI